MCPGNEDLPPVQVCPSKHQLRVMLRPNLTPSQLPLEASAKLDWLIWAVLVSETVQSDIKERAGGGLSFISEVLHHRWVRLLPPKRSHGQVNDNRRASRESLEKLNRWVT